MLWLGIRFSSVVKVIFKIRLYDSVVVWASDHSAELPPEQESWQKRFFIKKLKKLEGLD